MLKKILFILSFSVFLFLFLFDVNFPIKATVPTGNYLEVNGGYIKANNFSVYSPPGVTIEMWVNPADTGGIKTILSLGDQLRKRVNYEIGINGGSLAFFYRYDTSSLVSITSGNIEKNKWTHLGVALSKNSVKLFINGVAVSNYSGGSPLPPLGPDITLGNSILLNNSFKGLLDEVRVSFSEKDIAGLWKAGAYQNPLSASGDTLFLWHLDGIRGDSDAVDSSGNAIKGVLTGGDVYIHYYGILPSPTPYQIPTIRWIRPTLPAIGWGNPTITPISSIPTPTLSSPSPTVSSSWGVRPTRPYRYY